MTVDRVYFDQAAVDPISLGDEWDLGTDEQFALFNAERYDDVFD